MIPMPLAPVRRLHAPTLAELDSLAAVLVACVDAGASVGFMHPLTHGRALAFWQGVAAAVLRGERALLVAEADGQIVGTVQLVLALPENQPHRADLAKMLVHPGARRRGVGEALLHAAEEAARAAGRTLLVLDTASDAAARLYARAGWQPCGVVPGYALLPHGAPCDTTFFYRQLRPHDPASPARGRA